MSTAQARTPSAKRAAPPAGAAAVTRVAASKARTEPYMYFQYTKELRKRSEAVFQALEHSPEDTRHGAAMADLIADLVQAGMDYYFLRGLQAAKLGLLKEQSARLGISGAVQLINSVSRKFIVSMDSTQLQAVARHMRSLG